MRFLSIAAGILAGVASVTGTLADPTAPLAADDPTIGSGWRPPPSPTVGVENFSPVEAKDWLTLNKDEANSGGSMKGMTMKGMGMKGMDMKGMPGMGGASSGSDKGSMQGMPGMGGGK